MASNQGSEMVGSETGVAYLKFQIDQYTTKVVYSLKDCVEVQHPDLLTDTLTVLATQGW